ncbi:MAG: hypothetical protein LUD68_01050 [Rikenellaceae bacterium]|nr:hypothetical protein [Rikenellaceae bacterium]
MDFLEGGLTPFVDIRGTITDNSYRSLLYRNPYLYSGQFALNTIDYSGRAGLKEVIGSSFKYQLYGGYSILENAAFWANAYEGYDSPGNGASAAFYGNEGNVFTVLTDDLNYFEAGLEVQANFLNVFTLTGGLNYYHYSPDNFEQPWGMPEWKARFEAAYNHRNKLYIHAGFDYLGKRQMFSLLGTAGTVNEVAGQFDLKIGADYFIHKQFGMFVQLNNLLGHDIYYFNRYKELGINGTAGVKISF